MKKGLMAVASALAGAAAGAYAVGKVAGEATLAEKRMAEKHLTLFLMMNQWVRVKQEGKCLDSYFIGKKYKRIAIYGMSYAGETLVEELKDTEIQVAYGIDKNANSIFADVDVLGLEENMERVDAVVVTAVSFFDEIAEELSTKMDCPIISLEDILNEI